MPAPVNDDFADATVLVGASGTEAGTVVDATIQIGSGPEFLGYGADEGDYMGLAGASDGRSVWYRFDVPAGPDLVLTVDFSATYAIYAELWIETSPGVLEDLTPFGGGFWGDGTNDPPADSDVVPGGSTAYLWVTNYNFDTEEGTFSFDWAFAAAPANDDYADYEDIGDDLGGCVSGTLEGATAEGGEPDHGGNPASHSVWYRWRVPPRAAAADITLTVTSAMANTRMAVYYPDWGTLVAEDGGSGPGGQAQISDTFTANRYYRVAVDTDDVVGDDFTLTWEYTTASPPANDDFANAATLSGAFGTDSGTTVDATSECDEPPSDANGTPFGPYETVWYEWVAPRDGFVRFDIESPTWTYAHACAFTGATLDNLTEVAYAPGDVETTVLTFLAANGTTYWIRVGVPGYAEEDTFDITWVMGAETPPANDDFADAVTLVGTSGTEVGTTDGASYEVGEPELSGDSGIMTVWYKVEASATAGWLFASVTAEADSSSPSNDVYLELFEGTTLAGLTLFDDPYTPGSEFVLSTADGVVSSELSSWLTPGQTYYLRVSSFGGYWGSFSLDWSVGRVETWEPAGAGDFTLNGGASFAAGELNVSGSGSWARRDQWQTRPSPRALMVRFQVQRNAGEYLHRIIGTTEYPNYLSLCRIVDANGAEICGVYLYGHKSGNNYIWVKNAIGGSGYTEDSVHSLGSKDGCDTGWLDIEIVTGDGGWGRPLVRINDIPLFDAQYTSQHEANMVSRGVRARYVDFGFFTYPADQTDPTAYPEPIPAQSTWDVSFRNIFVTDDPDEIPYGSGWDDPGADAPPIAWSFGFSQDVNPYTWDSPFGGYPATSITDLPPGKPGTQRGWIADEFLDEMAVGFDAWAGDSDHYVQSYRCQAGFWFCPASMPDGTGTDDAVIGQLTLPHNPAVLTIRNDGTLWIQVEPKAKACVAVLRQNEWYWIELSVDMVDLNRQTLDVYVNGALMRSYVPYRTPPRSYSASSNDTHALPGRPISGALSVGWLTDSTSETGARLAFGEMATNRTNGQIGPVAARTLTINGCSTHTLPSEPLPNPVCDYDSYVTPRVAFGGVAITGTAGTTPAQAVRLYGALNEIVGGDFDLGTDFEGDPVGWRGQPEVVSHGNVLGSSALELLVAHPGGPAGNAMVQTPGFLDYTSYDAATGIVVPKGEWSVITFWAYSTTPARWQGHSFAADLVNLGAVDETYVSGDWKHYAVAGGPNRIPMGYGGSYEGDFWFDWELHDDTTAMYFKEFRGYLTPLVAPRFAYTGNGGLSITHVYDGDTDCWQVLNDWASLTGLYLDNVGALNEFNRCLRLNGMGSPSDPNTVRQTAPDFADWRLRFTFEAAAEEPLSARALVLASGYPEGWPGMGRTSGGEGTRPKLSDGVTDRAAAPVSWIPTGTDSVQSHMIAPVDGRTWAADMWDDLVLSVGAHEGVYMNTNEFRSGGVGYFLQGVVVEYMVAAEAGPPPWPCEGPVSLSHLSHAHRRPSLVRVQHT